MPTSLSELLTDIAPRCVGASEPLLLTTLLKACRVFCAETWVCSEIVGPISDADGVAAVTPASGLTALAPLRVTSNGRVIWSKWPAAADNALGYVDIASLSYSQPLSFGVGVNPLTIRMLPTATLPQNMLVEVAVGPSAIDNVPPDIPVLWRDAVVYRALQDLFELPGYPFTSPVMAVRQLQLYSVEREKARIELNRRLARHGTTVAGPKFIGR